MSHHEPTSRALSNLVIAKEQKLRSHVWRSSHRTLGKGLPATNAAGTEVSDLHLNSKKLDTNLCIRLDRLSEDLFFCPFGPRRACNHPIPAASRCCCMGGTNPYQSKEQISKHLNIASTAHVVMDVDAFCISLMQIDAEAVLLGMNEDVLELQVSMNNLMSMHVLNTICKLLEDVLCLQKLCSTCLQLNKKNSRYIGKEQPKI